MPLSLACQGGPVLPLAATPNNLVSYANPSLGIRLDLSVNSTSLEPGDKIAITINEQNLSPNPDKIQAASNWRLEGLSLSPCGTLDLPIGFAILKGYYTKDNVATGHPLQLYQPGPYFCPAAVSGIKSYVFDPESNLASVVTRASSIGFKLTIQGQGVFAGSWSRTMPIQGQTIFHQFSPGVYTVVGGDEWGDITILNFTVTQASCHSTLQLTSHPPPKGASHKDITISLTWLAKPLGSNDDLVGHAHGHSRQHERKACHD